MASRLPLEGYCDRPSVAPGETIRFFVSSERDTPYTAQLVRLLHGDLNPAGPGFREEVVASSIDGEHPSRRQLLHAGSYGIVRDAPELRAQTVLTVAALVWPTTPAKGRQGIIAKWSEPAQAGYGLFIDERGALTLTIGDGGGEVASVSATTPLRERCWYLVGASVDVERGRARVFQSPISSALTGNNVPFLCQHESEETAESEIGFVPGGDVDVPLILAGWWAGMEHGRPCIAGHFNGKLERPRVHIGRELSLSEILAETESAADETASGAWDFAAELGRDGIHPFARLTDRSRNALHGELVNAPTRGVTGHNWDGREPNYAHAPSQYGAIHFHDDDLIDAGWDEDFRLVLPDHLRSGVYAVRISAGADEEYIPFFVRPPSGTATAKIAFLIPTASYLAYANDNSNIDAEFPQLVTGRTPILQDRDIERHVHRDYGLSLYDTHSDGSGVCYSSWNRPLLTVRPKARSPLAKVWQFNADLHLTDWFERKGFTVDVITDHDLHREGAALLEPYHVVVSGTHPEYVSAQMLDGLVKYLDGGGRFIYLGANGFYWVTAFNDENGSVEVRRWGGTEVWTAQPGEYYLSTTDESGGIWRNRGRAPQKLVGIGFIAQGFDVSGHYRRTQESFGDDVAWIFEGVGEDELIGDFGLIGGGAAGLEIDCFDLSLGSPPHATILASSEGHTAVMLEVRENRGVSLPNLGGNEQPMVRADLVYFTTPGGGAVFSTGSIAWGGSLSHNGYDNNVSRITENVLRRFASMDSEGQRSK